MYESGEISKGEIMSESSGRGLECKRPPTDFRTRFEIVNTFEKGIGIGIKVDGILCLSKEEAEKVTSIRLNELYAQWEEYIKKI